ncbi:MAG: hypothetical protein IKO26_00035 [Paludibacteraceae bacterium]|nr:hypothetical protein [Paludibacteraceae bacterium]
MTLKHITFSLLATILLVGCGKAKQTSTFDCSKPLDLTQLLKAYYWYQEYEGDNRDSLLYTIINSDLPDDDFYLFDDTSFVLRIPVYASSSQPFLANAEDFYNSTELAWNIWSNYEVWYRGNTADLLVDNEEVIRSINAISVDIITDPEVRTAAQQFKDSLLSMMQNEMDRWSEDADPMALLMAFSEVIENKAYKFYDDEESFIYAMDSCAISIEESSLDRFQRYLDAEEDMQLKVMLEELVACESFDEQCSLWRNWANCKKSIMEDDWIVAVGRVLMQTGCYSPILNHVWITWRAMCQSLHFGSSRDSYIPNHYYNTYRQLCYRSCLPWIQSHPDDVYAMNCAAAIAGRSNMNRFGYNYFGNEAMIEEAMMLPNRFDFGELDEEEDLNDSL